MRRAQQIIEAETPKGIFKQMSSQAGPGGWLSANGFAQVELAYDRTPLAWKKETSNLAIFVRRLRPSSPQANLWQLLVYKSGKLIENTLHDDMASVRQALSVYDEISEAESPKKIFRDMRVTRSLRGFGRTVSCCVVAPGSAGPAISGCLIARSGLSVCGSTPKLMSGY